jgi:hypothetical protein
MNTRAIKKKKQSAIIRDFLLSFFVGTLNHTSEMCQTLLSIEDENTSNWHVMCHLIENSESLVIIHL